MITLYHCVDARSLRCLWALEEIGIEYRLQSLPFPPRSRAPEYLDVNPLGTVPYLVDETTTLNESPAILQYLAARYGGGLLPQPTEPGYADCLNWLYFGETELTVPLAMRLRFNLLGPEELRITAISDDFTQRFFDRLAFLDRTLASRDYVSASGFTVADISVGYALFLATRIGLADRLPGRLITYLETLQSRPAFQRARQKQKPVAS